MYNAAGLVSPAVMEGGCASEAHFGVLDGGGPLMLVTLQGGRLHVT